MKQAVITNVQRFSLDDGPGIRTTVFFKGCTLQCRWCHNPECITAAPELLYFRDKCISCGACAAKCPHGAHRMENGVHVYDRSKCVQCYACVLVCPKQALLDAGRPWDLDTLLQLLLRDRDFYETSGGGITVSGGEPLLWPDYIAALFRALKQEGIHTAVETAGNVPFSAYETVLPYTDLFLHDVKLIDAEQHRLQTGAANHRILSNLDSLFAAGRQVLVRIPVIPGANDDQLEKIADHLAGKPILGVELLPYHDMGRAKHEALDGTYPLQTGIFADQARMEAAVAYFRSKGLTAIIH